MAIRNNNTNPSFKMRTKENQVFILNIKYIYSYLQLVLSLYYDCTHCVGESGRLGHPFLNNNRLSSDLE